MGIGSSTNSKFNVLEKKANYFTQQNEILESSCGDPDADGHLPPLRLVCASDGGCFEALLFNEKYSSKSFCFFSLQDQAQARQKFRQLDEHLLPFMTTKSCFERQTLQTLLNCFEEHPSWSHAHVAAELELTDCFEDENFQKALESHQCEEQLTPLHLACKDGKTRAIKSIMERNPKLSTDLLGNTPLHYLVEKHPELVETMISALDSVSKAGSHLKQSLNILNNYSESPVHVAIRLSQGNILQILIDKGASDTITCGHAFPIHLALKHSSKSCTHVLLRHNEENVHAKDEKYGASPLHWAKTSEDVDLLINYKADKECKNNDGESPLLVMIKKKRLNCVITLISHDADINAIGVHGKSSLHYAVEAGDVDLVKALLILGADHTLQDEEDRTALGLAKLKSEGLVVGKIKDALTLFDLDPRGKLHSGSPTFIEEIKSKFTNGKQGLRKILNGSSPKGSILKQTRGAETILCLDGGGIRGLILTELLYAIEQTTGHPIRDLFDWVSGSSTGSYLALAIASGKPLEHCQRAYFRLKQNVFAGTRPYSSEPLEDFLVDEFGEDTMMTSIEYPRVIIPAVMVDRKPALLHLFRNYNAPYDEQYLTRDTRFPRPKKAEDQRMWRAARCSGAAPTYFRSMGRYVDGGLMSNNPSLDVLTEIHKYRKHTEKKESERNEYACKSSASAEAGETKSRGTYKNLGMLISLGTGRPPSEQIQGIDIFKPSSVWDTTRVLESARSFGELLVDQVTQSDGHVVERAKSWCEMIGLPYFRFSPTLSVDVELDEKDDRILIRMLWDTRQYVINNEEILERVGKILLGLDK